VRNQRLNASQANPTSSNLADLGWTAVRTHRRVRWGTLELVDIASREATVNVYGVAVAMPQGHSWAPSPSSGSTVNVGTLVVVPSPASIRLVGGKVRRRLTPPRGGGGPVVVRARERRAHGEGVQHGRGIFEFAGGRR
jgi:hypothetical protein